MRLRLEKDSKYSENLNKEFLPVGNSAKLMPLDITLNKGVHKCVRRHFLNGRRPHTAAATPCSSPLRRQRRFLVPMYRRVFDPVDLKKIAGRMETIQQYPDGHAEIRL